MAHHVDRYPRLGLPVVISESWYDWPAGGSSRPDLWDRTHLDLCGPAARTITAKGGEIAFGALEAGLEVEYSHDPIGFHWASREGGDEVDGEGIAELLDNGTLEIEFEHRNGDEAVLKAKRDPSSTGLLDQMFA